VLGLVSPVKQDGLPAAWNVPDLEQKVTVMRDASERPLNEVVTGYVAQITGIVAGRDLKRCIFVSLSDYLTVHCESSGDQLVILFLTLDH
jgi:hypothetical protein